jgi:hypothetical protein
MKCHQCEKVVFYLLKDNVGVCLDCYHKMTQINNIKFIQHIALANKAADDLDMIAGMKITGGRVPVAALAMAARGADRNVYNNIKINNSTIGIINTGDLAKIDAVITLTKETDIEQIGQKLMELTQAILDSKENQDIEKQELIDLVRSIAEQVQSGRKKSVILSLFKGIEERIQTISAAIPIYQTMKPLIEALFGK